MAPPFAPSDSGNTPLIKDYQHFHPRLGSQKDAASALHDVARTCKERGLHLLLDFVFDRVAHDATLAQMHPDLFKWPPPTAMLDPRRPPMEVGAARARLDDHVQWPRLIGLWTDLAAIWLEAGVQGFRMASLMNVSAAFLCDLIARLRDRQPSCEILGWTPGLSHEALEKLSGSGLDFTFSSLPWWNYREEWLWDEAAILDRVAPPIAPVEDPFGDRLVARTADPDLARRQSLRAVRFAATFGTGWMMPMGFEFSARMTQDAARGTEDDFANLRTDAAFDLSADIRHINALRSRLPGVADGRLVRRLSTPGAPVVAALCADAIDHWSARHATLILANADLFHAATVSGTAVLGDIDTAFEFFTSAETAGAESLDIMTTATLTEGDVALLQGAAAPPITLKRPPIKRTAREAAKFPRIAIENVSPSIDGGLFPARAIVGECVVVQADVICDGHEVLRVSLMWQPADAARWTEVPMVSVGNDRWEGMLPLKRVGLHYFTVHASHDDFGTFCDQLSKKLAAGVGRPVDLDEGLRLVQAAAKRPGEGRYELHQWLDRWAGMPEAARYGALLDSELLAAMRSADDRPGMTGIDPPLGIEAERRAAQFANWYEIFPRSMSDVPGKHGTFRDVIRHLPRIRKMGFNVLYFPPIHPIGHANRKGPNNSLHGDATDPGSPYAIGNADGGHDAVHPDLGTLEDFRALRLAAFAQGIEIALDFAIQCSPDHPWLQAHKEWFAWRPDGSLRYAENPPKIYEDIVNVDFYATSAIPDLWIALHDIVVFWIQEGISIFRVDNPHTKPLPFWQWLITEIRSRHPQVIFLAEAFTKPKMMNRLAKIGFSQSYTYFTWRNTKFEIQTYLQELVDSPTRQYFRPHFFVNTPDINSIFLQHSGRAGFLIRAALAATLSGLWGMYCGFELCEAQAVPGREEYLNSEKYQIRTWDWERPGNICPEIARLNHIRLNNSALHSHLGLTFYKSSNDSIIYFGKANADRSNMLLIAVSLNPFEPEDADLEIPLWEYGLSDDQDLAGIDLIHGGLITWHGKMQRLHLAPSSPYSIWRITRAT